MYEYYQNTVEELKRDSLQRSLTPVKKEGKYIFVEGKKYLNLSSNDYLGIADDKEIREKFYKKAFASKYSLGSASSRLLTGNSNLYTELENLLARLYQKEGALLFNSGYHANAGIMSAILNKNSAVFLDRLDHASIIDGIRLSGADFYRFKHLDYKNLESLLEKHSRKYENIIISTESLFSMDGDCADFEKLVLLKKKYNALLIVDEAHAFGVYGQSGLGVSEEYKSDIDIIVGTFGKAIGSMGAFCTADSVLIEYLINKTRPLIFSTALPEINIAFSHYVISEILPQSLARRRNLFEVSKKLSEKIRAKGLKTIGNSYIIPVILGDNETTVETCKRLRDFGYYLLPIRHPTVEKGSSRVRISLRADVDFSEVENLPDIFGEFF